MTTTAFAERQLTKASHGHILTNIGCWSHDGQWIVYDIRQDAAGEVFSGDRIERVHVESGRIEVLYESQRGAHCGVVTASPLDDRYVFILGPEDPTPAWDYAANRRQGLLVRASAPGSGTPLDARDLTPPFTPGALRGGTHVHVFSGDAQWVSFTYQDNVLASLDAALDLRNVGVSVPDRAVSVPKTHPRNHDGSHFSVLVTRTTPSPSPGSDEIKRAYSDAWVGVNGYVRPDGTRQHRAIAFLGDVVREDGQTQAELFLVDLPEDLTHAVEGAPLQGDVRRPPQPPRGVIQRRLTDTSRRAFPGIQGPRHWPRSAPDGSRIAFLMRDDGGVVQLWTVSPNGGEPLMLTNAAHSIASAFSWSPDGNGIACVIEDLVCFVDAANGEVRPLTASGQSAPRPEACVFSPDGRQVAFVRSLGGFNQIFVCSVR